MTEPFLLYSFNNPSKLNITDGILCDGKKYDKDTITNTSLIFAFGSLFNFKIIDSILWKGKQFATIFFNIAKKIEIAKALDKFEVKYISLLIYTIKLNTL